MKFHVLMEMLTSAAKRTPESSIFPWEYQRFLRRGRGSWNFTTKAEIPRFSGFPAEIATFAEISRLPVKIQLPGPRRENINIP